MQSEHGTDVLVGLVRLAPELDGAQVRQGLAQAALDGLNLLVYAVDPGARLVVSNACGERQLALCAPFCLESGCLSAAEPQVEGQLAAALRQARAGVGSGFRCIVGQEAWLVRVLPAGCVAGAAVIYATSTERGPVQAQLLKEMLGFSAAESEVAYMIAEGWSAKDIAHARHVAITTIRTQIREVFRKAGVRRQADLTRLLFSVPRIHEGDRPQA